MYGRNSTFFNLQYSIDNFLSTVEVELEGGDIEIRVDLLDPKLSSLMQNITQWKPYLYQDFEKIPAIAYKFYNTTTLWWIIMIYNGFTHPLEIQTDTIIKVPDINQVNTFLQELKRSKTVKTVRI